MESPRTKRLFPIVYSVPFLIAAGLSVLMLVTDKNLQTDFGTVSSGYFVHWYIILATAIADVVGAALLLAVRSRRAVLVGAIGSGALIAVLVGAIFTYAQVGFASAGDMANYLFGVTYYGGDIRYLYDALLATYIATFVMGVVGFVLTRTARTAGLPSENRNPTSSGT